MTELQLASGDVYTYTNLIMQFIVNSFSRQKCSDIGVIMIKSDKDKWYE